MTLLKVFIAILVVLYSSPLEAQEGMALQHFTGEKITYEIKKFGVKVGDATLAFEGKVVLDLESVYLITFTADGFNFFDKEKIYVDMETFLPIRVERNLNIFGTKEKITEYYEPQKGRVRVVKITGKATREQVVRKSGKLDNIYCFIYRYRKDGEFQIGDAFDVRLPTANIAISLLKRHRVAAGGKVYNAFFMRSTPSKYQLWFDDSLEKIPLRIDGAAGFGNTAMIMRKYQSPTRGAIK